MYKNNTVSFKSGGEVIRSRPFDFEAMCMINDRHITGEKEGPMRMCRDAAEYLFDGAEEFRALEPGAMAAVCMDVWDLYADALSFCKSGSAHGGESETA